jgi:hypothetical protein
MVVLEESSACAKPVTSRGPTLRIDPVKLMELALDIASDPVGPDHQLREPAA